MRNTAWWLLGLALVAGCEDDAGGGGGGGDDIDDADDRYAEAMAQASKIVGAENAGLGVVTLFPDRTIGERMDDRAEARREFWQSQRPCSTVTIGDADVLVVDFGGLRDDCVFDGRTFAGRDVVRWRSEDGALDVQHRWMRFTDGERVWNGVATVSFPADAGDAGFTVTGEHVVGSLRTGGLMGVSGTIDVLRRDPDRPIDEGGFVLDGKRLWEIGGEEWTAIYLELVFVPTDAAPESGAIVLENPDGDTMTIVYERVDEDTTSARVSDGQEERLFFVEADR